MYHVLYTLPSCRWSTTTTTLTAGTRRLPWWTSAVVTGQRLSAVTCTSRGGTTALVSWAEPRCSARRRDSGASWWPWTHGAAECHWCLRRDGCTRSAATTDSPTSVLWRCTTPTPTAGPSGPPWSATREGSGSAASHYSRPKPSNERPRIDALLTAAGTEAAPSAGVHWASSVQRPGSDLHTDARPVGLWVKL